MILAKVRGTLYATRKHPRFEGKRILVVAPETPEGLPSGASFLALDRAQAGIGDRVLINKEGSGARLMFGDEEIPIQAVIVAVVDQIEIQA